MSSPSPPWIRDPESLGEEAQIRSSPPVPVDPGAGPGDEDHVVLLGAVVGLPGQDLDGGQIATGRTGPLGLGGLGDDHPAPGSDVGIGRRRVPEGRGGHDGEGGDGAVEGQGSRGHGGPPGAGRDVGSTVLTAEAGGPYRSRRRFLRHRHQARDPRSPAERYGAGEARALAGRHGDDMAEIRHERGGRRRRGSLVVARRGRPAGRGVRRWGLRHDGHRGGRIRDPGRSGRDRSGHRAARWPRRCSGPLGVGGPPDVPLRGRVDARAGRGADVDLHRSEPGDGGGGRRCGPTRRSAGRVA